MENDMKDLPGSSDVGKTGDWTLPSSRDDADITLTLSGGRFLGWSTSLSHRHTHGGPHVPNGSRCSACRWSEFRIFRTGSSYVLHLTGRSVVPGETPRYRHEDILTAHEVLETLTMRRRSPSGVKEAFLTVPAGRVMAQASSFDLPLRDAWENRAVL